MWCQQNIIEFLNTLTIKTRPNAGPGIWLIFLLPLALIISTATQSIIATDTYKLSSIFSLGLISSSSIFLHQISKRRRLQSCSVRLVFTSILVAVLFRICLHRGILFSIWSGIFSVIIYHKVYEIVLEKLPECFTLGEAAIFSQSYTLLLYFTGVNICNNFVKAATSHMQISTLIIQLGLCGVSTIILMTYQWKIKKSHYFYVTTLLVFLFITILPLQVLLRQNPLLFILNLFFSDIQGSKIVLYWSFCSALSVLFVNLKISKAKKASTAVRKVFHILAVAVFLPGLLYNCSFLYLASGVVLGIFFALEIVRILGIQPFSSHLQNGLIVFGDEKDAGIIALTPIYLLAGCSLPLWLHPSPCDVTNSATFNLLPLLSGLLTIGVGDMAASIVGSKFGRYHWPGSNRTVEGTLACILSQLAVIYILVYLDYLKFFTTPQIAKTVGAVLITSILEATTDQVDNLVLPFVMYIILIIPV